MKKLASIIIVNWNGKEYLKNCLTSLKDQDYENIEIIFVDNNSNDGSIDYVKNNFPEVKVVSNKENLGFVGGNNVGYRYAAGEYVLILNNDTQVTKTFLLELVRALESDEKIGAVQSKILLMDNPGYLDSAGSYLTPTGFLYYFGIQKKDEPKYNKQMFIYSAKGACVLFRREVLKRVELEGNIFDKRFFCYFEETDLMHRIWLAGYKIMYVPKSVIYHKMGATSARIDNSFIQYHSFKNRINAHLKNLGIMQLVLVLPLHLLICEFFALASLMSKNVKLFIAVQKAIWWNIGEIQTTLKFRKIIQNTIRKVSDKSIEKYIYKYPPLNYYYHIKDLSKYEDYEQN